MKVPSQAQEYKLLLYEEGAFFKAHKDSEKVPGMFGTLVICLPSEHTGGEVHLVQGKEKRILQTAESSKFDLSALAWYSDVQHEVQPVTSGYRLVLTYNLVHDQSLPRQTASILNESHSRLARLLYTWRSAFPSLDKLVYPLEHKYTEASLCMKNLKGSDAAKGRYLDQICSKNGMFWFLVRLTRETINHDGDEEEYSHSLGRIATPSGGRIMRSWEIDPKMVLADSLYDDRDADSEEEEEYTGNEGMNSMFRYHDTVLILVKKGASLERYFRAADHGTRISKQPL